MSASRLGLRSLAAVSGVLSCFTSCSPESTATRERPSNAVVAGNSAARGLAAGSAVLVAGNAQPVAGSAAVVRVMPPSPANAAGSVAMQPTMNTTNTTNAMNTTTTTVTPPVTMMPSTVGAAGATAAPMQPQMPAHTGDGKPSMLPTPKGTCEDFRTGVMKFNGMQVQIWAGAPAAAPGGPLLIYWHGTGTSADEAVSGFGQAGINDVMAQGGIVASFIDTTMQGSVSGGTIWYSGDLDVADEIVACAIEKQKIDVTRIHSSGYSAGGLQTGAMVTQRANYIASGLIYSGGVIAFGPGAGSSNVPPIMCAHGATGSDVLGLDFAMACESLETQTTMKGGFAVDCNDGGAHIDILTRFAPASFGYKFLTTHPYGTKPSPWMGMLPGDAPKNCKIWSGM